MNWIQLDYNLLTQIRIQSLLDLAFAFISIRLDSLLAELKQKVVCVLQHIPYQLLHC